MHYVVIDTNVLVSALITRNELSPTVRILRMLAQGKIVPVYSKEILEEYRQVLRREKFKLDGQIVDALIKDIAENGIEITRFKKITEKILDPKDVVFYLVTVSSLKENTMLVTGNGKHFPVKPFIVTPAQLVSLIE